MKTCWLLSAMLAALLLCSCASTQSAFLNPLAELDFYESVAVVPFWNTTGDRTAGEKVSDSFVTELMITEKYHVIEPGQFRHKLVAATVGLDGSRRGLDAEQIKKAGESAGVQALFEGTVLSYEMARIGQGSYPLITVELRMLDVETGELIWMTTVTRKGGPTIPFFGFGEIHTLGELTQKVTAELARSVP